MAQAYVDMFRHFYETQRADEKGENKVEKEKKSRSKKEKNTAKKRLILELFGEISESEEEKEKIEKLVIRKEKRTWTTTSKIQHELALKHHQRKFANKQKKLQKQSNQIAIKQPIMKPSNEDIRN